MGPITTGTDLLVTAFVALSPGEQEEALRRVTEIHNRGRAEGALGNERFLRSLQLAAEHLGERPNSTQYRRAWQALGGAGGELENLQAVIRHFGSWRQAREALELSIAGGSDRQVQARIDKRRLDKIWRYTEATLRSTLASCVEDLGHVPQVAEYEHWRARRLELAKAQGDDAAHLPSAGPYRRRYGSCEKTLLSLGYVPDEVAERLERG